jgi:cytochrome bd-type quinol oxidase subunit 2
MPHAEKRELSEIISGLENPFPYFAEATDAASRFFQTQREYLKISTELRAKREARRVAYWAAAVVCINIALTLTFFWITMQIHDAGWSSWLIALLSLVVFGALATVFALVGIKAGKAPGKPSIHSNPSQEKAA